MAPLSMSQIARDYETDGVPPSGPHQIKKSELRSWGGWVETVLDAVGVNAGVVYLTRDNLFADLTKTSGTMAWVVQDATPEYNGIYRKSGGAGTGSWSRVSDLPYSFIVATDLGEGTPDAVQATTTVPVSESALVLLTVADANTGSPVTVSFNGGTPLTVKSNSGNDISAGGLQAGMSIMGRVSGSTFRIVTDQVSAAIIAQAEAWAAEAKSDRDDAETFASEAQAAASSILAPFYGFRSGGILSNNATDAVNDIDIAPFIVSDDTGQYTLSTSSIITKRVDAAWAAGSGNGGLDTGSVATGFYSFWVIGGASVPTDVLISASWNMPTMPAGYTRKRYLGRLGFSSGWYLFKQTGNHFRRRALLSAAISTVLAANTPTMITLPTAPSGGAFLLDLQYRALNASAGAFVFLNSPDDPALATLSNPNQANIGIGTANASLSGKLQVYSDSIQRVRGVASNANTTIDLQVAGWWDPYL